ICQLRGKTGIFDTKHSHWIPKDREELRHWSTAYRDAQTLDERKTIFENHGIRWSSLWLLDYWDPTRMLVIDAMHCVLEGIVHYHCRHVLRLDGSNRQTSTDGTSYAFDWSWTPYDQDSVPNHLKLDPKHIPGVAKTQDALCYAIEGDNSLSLDRLWTRIDNRSTLGSLKFVAHTLELPLSLNTIDPTISSLYNQRVQCRERNNTKKKKTRGISLPSGENASQKNHFIALLLTWRLKQPHNSSAFIFPTGTPEILLYIQRVIRETITPSWLNSVPKNFGDAKAGTIKADEWRTLATIFLPIALITLWGDHNGSAPASDTHTESGFLLQALDRTMDLFQAT
ncbi:hypothetical protein BT96DRAFT_795446, partial [Gymnopus androsaceus JB14]